MSANDKQIGGDHYKGKAIQPWDYIAANGLGFFEGNVVRYVSRWRDKGGVDDLKKAIHFLEKLIEIATAKTDVIETDITYGPSPPPTPLIGDELNERVPHPMLGSSNSVGEYVRPSNCVDCDDPLLPEEMDYGYVHCLKCREFWDASARGRVCSACHKIIEGVVHFQGGVHAFPIHAECEMKLCSETEKSQ